MWTLSDKAKVGYALNKGSVCLCVCDDCVCMCLSACLSVSVCLCLCVCLCMLLLMGCSGGELTGRRCVSIGPRAVHSAGVLSLVYGCSYSAGLLSTVHGC